MYFLSSTEVFNSMFLFVTFILALKVRKPSAIILFSLLSSYAFAVEIDLLLYYLKG